MTILFNVILFSFGNVTMFQVSKFHNVIFFVLKKTGVFVKLHNLLANHVIQSFLYCLGNIWEQWVFRGLKVQFIPLWCMTLEPDWKQSPWDSCGSPMVPFKRNCVKEFCVIFRIWCSEANLEGPRSPPSSVMNSHGDVCWIIQCIFITGDFLLPKLCNEIDSTFQGFFTSWKPL